MSGSGSNTATFIHTLNELSQLRYKVIHVLNNPIKHTWSMMVASDLPDHLNEQLVDRLEATTLQKFQLIDRLIQERTEIERAEEFANYFAKKAVSGG